VRTGAARPRPRKKRAAEHHASAVRRARVARSPAAERARSHLRDSQRRRRL
jgi:hypothetical protein